MKHNFYVLILLLFSCNNAPQEKVISKIASFEWFEKYYTNQESLQERLSYFYELLEQPIDKESLLYLYGEQ